MPKRQLHKRLSDDQVRAILHKVTNKEILVTEAMRHLEIGRTRFYQLIPIYQDDPKGFSLKYVRSIPTRKIDPAIENNILKELKIEKEKIIDNPDVATQRYNYSYIRNLLQEDYQQIVSVPTIIARAKNAGYWKEKPPKKVHDREVITNFVGELIQHDSSHHLWAPDAKEKWYLITSIDDYSRALLYADFWSRETSWYHILALQSVFLKYGFPFAYYADQHSIFRYVHDRDKHNPWHTYKQFTDDVDPQWKLVLKDCDVKAIYALSPQAKGKVERPYQWLQDHVVRTCVRKGVTAITEARKILAQEVERYNWHRIHSTTLEVPMIRFTRACKDKKTLFRNFVIKSPLQSVKDIFCLRVERTVDSYRKISLAGVELKVPGVLPRQTVELRLYPDLKTGLTEVRFWWKDRLMGFQQVKSTDLPIVHL